MHAATLIGICVTSFVILLTFWRYRHSKLQRIRALACPKCAQSFSVPSLSVIRRWKLYDLGSMDCGFFLHCPQCRVDCLFADSLSGRGVADEIPQFMTLSYEPSFMVALRRGLVCLVWAAITLTLVVVLTLSYRRLLGSP
jgi:hypothetical protein